METWQKVWRFGIAPVLSEGELEALAKGLREDDQCLIQGNTCYPIPMSFQKHWPVTRACAVAYCGWQGQAIATVGEVEDYFSRVCLVADQNLHESAACRHFLNWFDQTPREEARTGLLEEVESTLRQRKRKRKVTDVASGS